MTKSREYPSGTRVVYRRAGGDYPGTVIGHRHWESGLFYDVQLDDDPSAPYICSARRVRKALTPKPS